MKNKLLLLSFLLTQITFAQLETLKDIYSDTNDDVYINSFMYQKTPMVLLQPIAEKQEQNSL